MRSKAATSGAVIPPASVNTGALRLVRTSVWMIAVLSGGSATTGSPASPAALPRPKRMTGPKTASRATPTYSSVPLTRCPAALRSRTPIAARSRCSSAVVSCLALSRARGGRRRARARAGDRVGGERSRHLPEQALVPRVAREQPERLHGALRRRELRDAGLDEARLGAPDELPAHPAGDDRLRLAAARRDDRLRALGRASRAPAARASRAPRRRSDRRGRAPPPPRSAPDRRRRGGPPGSSGSRRPGAPRRASRRVSSASGGTTTPRSAAQSAASRLGPRAFVRIASRLPLTVRGSRGAGPRRTSARSRGRAPRRSGRARRRTRRRTPRLAPAPCRPAFTTTTGFIRAASRSPLRNARAERTVSTYRRMLFVSRSSARYSSTSPKSTSRASPSDTTVENPIRCAAAQSSAVAQIAPDWDTRPSDPGIAPPFVKVASSRAPGRISPTLFGPTRRSPPRAASARSARVARSSAPPRAAVAPETPTGITAPPTPRSAQARTMAGSASTGDAMMARSTSPSTSASEAQERTPGRGPAAPPPIAWIAPANPPATTFRSTRPPTESAPGGAEDRDGAGGEDSFEGVRTHAGARRRFDSHRRDEPTGAQVVQTRL